MYPLSDETSKSIEVRFCYLLRHSYVDGYFLGWLFLTCGGGPTILLGVIFKIMIGFGVVLINFIVPSNIFF